METRVSCGVCGHTFVPDEDHRVVEVLSVRVRDADRRDEFYLHERCAAAVFDGWERP